MTLRLVVAAVVVAIAVGATVVVERRRTRRAVVSGVEVPTRVDRADFGAAAAPWLVVLFSNAGCESCAVMRERATALGSDEIAVYEVDYGRSRAVHERYGIAAVPTTVVVDRAGDVRASWVGAADPAELRAAVDELLAPS